MKPKEKVECIWAVICLVLATLFAFTQVVPAMLAPIGVKLAFGLTVSFCAGSTFFLMGVPVIDAVAEAIKKNLEKKHGSE